MSQDLIQSIFPSVETQKSHCFLFKEKSETHTGRMMPKASKQKTQDLNPRLTHQQYFAITFKPHAYDIPRCTGTHVCGPSTSGCGRRMAWSRRWRPALARLLDPSFTDLPQTLKLKMISAFCALIYLRGLKSTLLREIIMQEDAS